MLNQFQCPECDAPMVLVFSWDQWVCLTCGNCEYDPDDDRLTEDERTPYVPTLTPMQYRRTAENMLGVEVAP